jgi:hypothetical protein
LGKVFFIKLIRVLAVVGVVGLICYLLSSAARKNATARQRRQEGKAHRKFVESSVIEKKDETSESDKENS